MEIKKEFTQIVNDKPVTEEEFERVKKNMVLLLPGSADSNHSVMNTSRSHRATGVPADLFPSYQTG